MGTAIAGTRFDKDGLTRLASVASAASVPSRVASRLGSGRASGHGRGRLAVYVHFPWCLAKCPYCDFVSYAAPRDAIDHDGYANAVIRELERRVGALQLDTAVEIGSVFFGGGTPSLWAPRALGRVLQTIVSMLPVSDELEVTVECNPTSIDRPGADALADEGVSRLSIGAQALRPDQLRFLGRLHDVRGATSAIEAALLSRVRRVSADMIFGLPGQSPEDARDQAESLATLGISHLSAYQLTIEPGTKFGELARIGRLPRAEDQAVAESFVAIEEALVKRGFSHYEISNYAMPAEEARHNLAYWYGDPYLGVGCGAYGFLRMDERTDGVARGARYRNPTDPGHYVEHATRTTPLVHASDNLGEYGQVEALDADTLLRERIMLGLRLEEGFDLGEAARSLGVHAWTPQRERAVSWLVARERLERRRDRLKIPGAARLWADDTAARLF